MIAIRITTNIPRVAGRVAKLPNRLESYSGDIGLAWANDVVSGAKRRAPHDTGTLKKNIDYRRITKKGGIVSTKRFVVGIYGKAARYGRYVESGWKPHWIPVDFIYQHQESPGQKGQFVEEPSGWVLSHPYNVRTGFISDSLESSIRRLPTIVKRTLSKLKKR